MPKAAKLDISEGREKGHEERENLKGLGVTPTRERQKKVRSSMGVCGMPRVSTDTCVHVQGRIGAQAIFSVRYFQQSLMI